MDLFQVYRTSVGEVSDGLSSSVQVRGGNNYYLTTTVGSGSSFHIYSLDKLRLMFVGSSLCADQSISLVVPHGDYTFLALSCGSSSSSSTSNQIAFCHRGKLLSRRITFAGHGPISKIRKIALVGDNLLAVLTWKRSSSSSIFFLYEISKDCSEHRLISFSEFPKHEGFLPDEFVCLPTYFNKLLFVDSYRSTLKLASVEGEATQEDFSYDISVHFESSEKEHVTCLVAAPVLDLIGIASNRGKILIYDLSANSVLFGLNSKRDQTINHISFCSSGDSPFLLCDCGDDIIVWNLEERIIYHRIEGAHNGGLSFLQFLPGQTVFVSVGAKDNAVKEWKIDNGKVDLWKFRNGHKSAPRSLEFVSECHFISMDNLSLRFSNARRDEQSLELNCKGMFKNFSLPLLGFATNIKTANQPWNNTVVYNAKELIAFQLKNGKIITSISSSYGPSSKSNQKIFKLTLSDSSSISSVALSNCGHFVAIGSESSGAIQIYNLQSGILRKTLSSLSTTKNKVKVVGLYIDSGNKYLISITDSCSIMYWNFSSRKGPSLDMEIKINDNGNDDTMWIATKTFVHLESELIAIICFNGSRSVVVLFDSNTRKIIRRFQMPENCHSNDVVISPNTKWLISANSDGSLKIFDILSGYLLSTNYLKANEVPIAIGFSADSQWLLVSIQGRPGMRQLSNASLYMSVAAAGVGNSLLESSGNEETEDAWNDLLSSLSIKDIPQQEITFSDKPRQFCHSLLYLDSIRLRNRPKQPPKAPENLPFYLGSTTSLSNAKDISASTATVEQAKATEDSNMCLLLNSSSSTDDEFTQLLQMQEFSSIDALIQSYTPSQLDLAIRNLSDIVNEDVTRNNLNLFLKFILYKQNKEIDITQALLFVFLKIHTEALLRDVVFHKNELLSLLNSECHLNEQIRECNFLLDYCKE